MTHHFRFSSRESRMKASEIRELLKLLDRPDIISFAGGIPDAALFPADAFRQAYGEVLEGAGAGAVLQYSPSEGHPGLRDWIAEEMGRLGIPCGRDNIVITSGSQQALDFLGKLFLSPGDTALVTWPTYLGALQAFNACEPNYDRLDAMANRAPADYAGQAGEKGGSVKFAYLSPDFANPTGETMTGAQRERVLDFADALDIAVIEDGAYQSLRYDGEAIPPLLALEIARKGGIDDCRTIYCGTFSKTLSPGLRIGWVCAARDIVSRLVILKQAGDLHSATINQVAMERVARSCFHEQVERIRAVYAARRDRMLRALEREMPAQVQWTRPEGGMFVWLTLPEGLDGAALLARSVEWERVAFVPGRAFFPDGSGANTLRLSFSCAPGDMIDEGIRRLAGLVREAVGQVDRGRLAGAA
ncbi:PLP-dependent aminotransferase family protein [Oricola thermophila]|uniref:PLP-dependent aminotransferase family protein n=1 Tax=Oricola thermophila TaxID=2742145 RepID=A0A6N1V8M6_9HYPH|nr:PLP-dependent aminotransferase family protein [Oricola thermophila]QKV17280.1 PLP-dependent aminotransferase family protein [Oricola thermophila]